MKCSRLAAGGLAMFAATAVAQSNFASEFPARILAAHNAERAQVGLPGVVWDPALGTAAAAYAQQMAMTGRFEHSDRKARRGVGENLWMGSRGAYSPESMVGGWASEKRMFMPGVFPNNSRNGNWIDVAHYTQMIWPTTQRIGCALASTPRTDYLVCRYAPAGNIDGKPVGRWPVERG
jgi:Cysteine-rich secretory protein family